MKYHFASVPALGGEAAAAELNRFLGAHRVTHVERTFVPDGPASFWSFSVMWQEGPAPQTSPVVNAPRDRKQVDYKELLTDDQFKVFARLRRPAHDPMPIVSVAAATAKTQGPGLPVARVDARANAGRVPDLWSLC